MARILVVEDEPNMRKLLLMHLRGEGHSLVETGSLREGLNALHHFKPPLLMRGAHNRHRAHRDGPSVSVAAPVPLSLRTL